MKPYDFGLKALFENDFPRKIDAKLGRQRAKLYSKTVAPYQSFRTLMIGRAVLATLLFGCATTSFATTLPQVSIGELFREADVVALVQVVEGVTLGAGNDTCGAHYKAVVVEGLKGAKTSTSIQFGHFFGYRIGNRYILFLTKPGRTFEPKSTTNNRIEQAHQAARAKCAQKWTTLGVMHSGFGALPVEGAQQFQYKDAVRVPYEYIGLPTNIESKPAKASDGEEGSDVKWIRLDDLLKLLKQLSK